MPTGEWQVHLVEDGKGQVPLSRMGSGVKTVLLVLCNLLVIPHVENRNVRDYIFAFEELENNLHPALQRRLFRYLREFAVQHGCHVFLTTHSNVVIDLFSDDDHAQIVHVSHDRSRAECNTIKTQFDGCHILDDLEIKASDLLQTNVVVWLEGPSDRVYWNRWIDLWSGGKIVEGVDYQCLPYGGSLCAHLSIDSPELIDELIPVLKINRNAIILMDSDRRDATTELKKHVRRLDAEVSNSHGFAWITDGREVENYIPIPAFRRLWDDPAIRGPGKYKNVLEFVKSHENQSNLPRKVEFAHKIVPHITREDLASHLDLSVRLEYVCELIRKWNHVKDEANNA